MFYFECHILCKGFNLLNFSKVAKNMKFLEPFKVFF